MTTVRTTRNGYIADAPGLRVDTTASSATLSIIRRGYTFGWEQYHGDISSRETHRSGPICLHLRGDGGATETVRDPKTGMTLGEGYWDRRSFAGSVVTNACYALSSYSDEPVLRGDTRYFDTYDEWAFHIAEALETLEHAEIPKREATPKKSKTTYADAMDSLIYGDPSPIGSGQYRGRFRFDPATVAAPDPPDPPGEQATMPLWWGDPLAPAGIVSSEVLERAYNSLREIASRNAY